MIVRDVRGKNQAGEANTHTEILEGILEDRIKHKKTTKLRGYLGEVSSLATLAGAGYLAGYAASGGDHDAATQSAEYATVFYAGFKLGIQTPLRILFRKNHKDIEDKINRERAEAEELEARGEFHRYKPENGLDFKNSGKNFDNLIENAVQSNYWGNLETARKPITRTIRNCLYGAGALWLASLIVDGENNIVDLVGPNPIEKGLELTHYLFGQITPLKDYLTQNAHAHTGDFNQMQMAGIGLASGLITSAKQFIKGKYSQIKARLKK
jgi:hypothetical protein